MMNNELRPYEEMKNSYQDWLAEVPNHWRLAKAKRIFRETSIKDHPNEELLSATQTRGVIPRKLLETRVVMPMGNFESFKLVKEGNFVISLRSFQGGLEYSKYHGIVSPAYNVLEEFTGQNRMYFKHLMKSQVFISELQRNVTGIRQGKNIDVNDFREIIMPIPPRTEQDQIVRYLDHQLAKINKFIKAKKKLIAVLKEQKQAIINEAVTKGWDPNVKMKASGIEWLGDVPEHWKVTPLKRILEVKMTDGPHETPAFLDYGIPFVSADAVQDGKLHLKRMRGYISQEDHKKYCEKIKPQINDIFIVKSGSTTGKSCIVDFKEDFSVWSPLALVRTKQEFEPYFVFNAICSTYFQKQVENKWSFGTQPNIGMGVLQNLIITIPDYSEQIVIAKTIRERTTGIDVAIKKINDEIDLITEYKNSLISDVVTGKVDVRNIVIEESEEEIIEETELDEDSIDDESLESEDGDE